MTKKMISSGWATSEFAVVVVLVGPWAANYLGIDLVTVAALFGFLPTDAEQVRMLAAQIKSSQAATTPWAPLAGLAYVVGRPWLKAKGLSLDCFKINKDAE